MDAEPAVPAVLPQLVWDELFPFADKKALKAARLVGLKEHPQVARGMGGRLRCAARKGCRSCLNVSCRLGLRLRVIRRPTSSACSCTPPTEMPLLFGMREGLRPLRSTPAARPALPLHRHWRTCAARTGTSLCGWWQRWCASS